MCHGQRIERTFNRAFMLGGRTVEFVHDGDPMTTARSLGDLVKLETLRLPGDEQPDEDADGRRRCGAEALAQRVEGEFPQDVMPGGQDGEHRRVGRADASRAAAEHDREHERLERLIEGCRQRILAGIAAGRGW